MNSTFNIKRFGLLLRRQWLDFGKIYLLSLVVLAGVLMGLYILNMPKLGDNIYYWGKTSRVRLDFRLPVFLILGFIFISIMASNYFSVMGQKAKAVAELMIPASTFEKTLAGIIYTTIISMAGYFAIFYFIDKAFVLYLDSLWQYQSMLNNFTGVMNQVRFSSIRQDLLTDGDSKYLFVTPVLITSIFLLGSIYFNRFHYIKTAVSTIVFITITGYIVIIKINDVFTKGMVMNNHISYREDKSILFIAILIITSLLTLAFWLITYIRLKEKEV